MKNNALKELTIWLLSVSPLWWTGGCYTMKTVEKPGDVEKKEIKGTTKGNNEYIFREWAVDSLGTIRGRVLNPHYRSGRDRESGVEVSNGQPMYLEGVYSLPKDRTASVQAEGFNIPLTLLASVGVAAAAGLLVVITIARSMAKDRRQLNLDF